MVVAVAVVVVAVVVVVVVALAAIAEVEIVSVAVERDVFVVAERQVVVVVIVVAEPGWYPVVVVGEEGKASRQQAPSGSRGGAFERTGRVMSCGRIALEEKEVVRVRVRVGVTSLRGVAEVVAACGAPPWTPWAAMRPLESPPPVSSS